MTVVRPDYEFLYSDVETNGRVYDGGIWSKTSLARAIQNGELLLQEPEVLPYGVKKAPCIFVGDDAFALKTYLMKPYPQSGLSGTQRNLNHRLNRARRISENYFVMLTNRWRAFPSAIDDFGDNAPL